jgi:peroxiredoxin
MRASLLLSLIGLTTTLLLAPLTVHAEPAMVGNPAPDFTVQDSSGKAVSLHDFKGKTVVLEWFNQNCPFVKKFYSGGDMQRFQSIATNQGVVWLTVTSSAEGKSGHLDTKSGTAVRSELGMNSTALLLDSDGKVGKMYGARTTPHTFVIDPNGTLAYAGAIDSTPSTTAKDIAGATNYVMAAIDAIKAGKTIDPASTEPYGCSVKY